MYKLYYTIVWSDKNECNDSVQWQSGDRWKKRSSKSVIWQLASINKTNYNYTKKWEHKNLYNQ